MADERFYPKLPVRLEPYKPKPGQGEDEMSWAIWSADEKLCGLAQKKATAERIVDLLNTYGHWPPPEMH